MTIKWLSLVRLLGMVLVLLYHFFRQPFSGGFIGVDVFFVLSGFLTTAVFIDEFVGSGKIDLLAFYRKRLYRILPPLVMMILLVLPLTLFIRRDFIASIGTQIAAALGFVTNFYEISLGGSYENQFVPHLFLHTWTLAVEVQLYLIWAVLVWAFAKFAKTKEQLRFYLFSLASVLLLVTFVRVLTGSIGLKEFSSIYYDSTRHSFPFFMGAILATVTGLKEVPQNFGRRIKSWTRKRRLILFGGASGLITLLTFLLKFDNVWTYWLGLLLASMSATALIFLGRLMGKTGRSWPIVSFLSNTSYGIYLYHWPLYLIFSEMAGKGVAVAVSLLLSLIFATLSYYVIEPLVMGKDVRFMGVSLIFQDSKRWLAYLVAPFALITLFLVITAPRLGALESDLVANQLEQASTKLGQTRDMADGKLATDYGVQQGVLVIGDSVALRASDGIVSALPGATVDGEVSRELNGVYAILQQNIDNGTLPQNVVVAAGTNPSEAYMAELDNIVNLVPAGHRLILVTPYDGRMVGSTVAISNLTRDYELTLADKYPWITIADWYQVASQNPQIWYNTDLVHFGNDSNSIQEGQNLYGQMLANAVKEAENKEAKKVTNGQ